jgi:hypothetical protein
VIFVFDHFDDFTFGEFFGFGFGNFDFGPFFLSCLA